MSIFNSREASFLMVKRYRFVDFAAQAQKGFRNHVVEIHEVPRLVQQFKARECFCTYFFYTDQVFAYMTTHEQSGHPSIAGFDGKVWAPFFPIDLDTPPHPFQSESRNNLQSDVPGNKSRNELSRPYRNRCGGEPNLDRALEAARTIARTVFEHWQVNEEACHIYFSGSKGFHFLFDVRLFGKVTPSKNLHLMFSTLRMELLYEFPDFDRSVVDLSIKDRVRLLRLPNTVNAKSQAYKIPLSYHELASSSVAEIQAKARAPRPLTFTDETGLLSKVKVGENSALSKIFQHVHRQVRRYTRKPFVYRFKPKFGDDPEKFLCPGFLKIWQSHVEPGFRNNCSIRLLSEFRRNGLSEGKSRELIYQWNERYGIGLTERELEHTLHSAYARPYPYRYGCHDPILQHFCSHENFHECDEWRREMGRGRAS